MDKKSTSTTCGISQCSLFPLHFLSEFGHWVWGQSVGSWRVWADRFNCWQFRHKNWAKTDNWPSGMIIIDVTADFPSINKLCNSSDKRSQILDRSRRLPGQCSSVESEDWWLSGEKHLNGRQTLAGGAGYTPHTAHSLHWMLTSLQHATLSPPTSRDNFQTLLCGQTLKVFSLTLI